MRKKEVEKYYHAAKRMIQEEYLNYCISNPANRSLTPVKLSRTMICIKPMRKNEEGYVFDPERSVLIGRDKERCDICLQDVTVSGQHCELFLYEGEIYLQDLNSQNGTVVKRRIFSHTLYGEQELLRNRDRFKVGSTWFMIMIFYYDSAFE